MALNSFDDGDYNHRVNKIIDENNQTQEEVDELKAAFFAKGGKVEVDEEKAEYRGSAWIIANRQAILDEMDRKKTCHNSKL